MHAIPNLYIPCSVRQKGPDPASAIRALRERIYDEAADAQSEVIEELVRACFRGQREPDGTPWPERADGSGKPLLLTIEDALTYLVDREPGSIGSVLVDCPTKPHAEYQTHGTHVIPARPWAPEPGESLPPAWADAVDRRLKRTFRRAWEAALASAR